MSENERSDVGSTGTSATARQKFECPACGADAHWNAAKQALVCPFCGTESPATLQTRGTETVIVEHDLVAALRDIPDARRGWQAAKVSVKCQSCQAISVFDPERIGQRCEFCGSSQLVPYEQVKDAFSPESLLPFAPGRPTPAGITTRPSTANESKGSRGRPLRENWIMSSTMSSWRPRRACRRHC